MAFKKTFYHLSLILFLTMPLSVNAQALPAAMTGEALKQFANGTIDKLTNAGTQLMGNGSVVLGGASSQLSALLNQLNTMLNRNVKTPIKLLSDNIRDLSSQIYSMASRINNILDRQQSCLLLNSESVITSIKTAISTIKPDIFFIKGEHPSLSSFTFEKHSRSIVPLNGGRVKIDGFALWTKLSLPPTVTILSEDEKRTILIVSPSRGTDDNSFTFILSPAFIHSFAGQCLQIKVVPKKTKWYFHTQDQALLYLPICIPEVFVQKFKIVCHLQYSLPTLVEREPKEYRSFYFDNTAYNPVTVSHSESWTLPADGQIVGYEFAPNSPGKREESNISVSTQGNTITAAGTLGEAKHFTGFITHYIHSAYWQGDIRPLITYPKSIETLSSDSTTYQSFDQTTANFCVNLDKKTQDDSNTVFWFEIFQQKNKEKDKLFYASPKKTGAIITEDFNGLEINASLNSVPVNGKAQICIRLQKSQCGL